MLQAATTCLIAMFGQTADRPIDPNALAVCELLQAAQRGDEDAFAARVAAGARNDFLYNRNSRHPPNDFSRRENLSRASFARLLSICSLQSWRMPDPSWIDVVWQCRAGFPELISSFEVQQGKVQYVMTLPPPIAN